MSAVRWQWLVDFRERAGGQRGSRSKHEGMIDAFRRQQVPCTSVMLPCGDFMLAVDLSPQEADELQQAHQRGSSSAASVLSQAEESTNEVRGATGNAPAEPSPIFGHVCSLVVERKTAADLDASVKGSRYSEQRRLLEASPYALVVWLIEGTDVGGGGAGRSAKGGFFSRPHTCPQQGGSRSPSPAPNDSDVASATDVASVASPTSPSSPVESAQQRVDSACASLGMQQQQQHGSWLVVRTRNTAESVQFLKQLALQVARQLAARRLTHRETSSASRSALPIVTTDMDLARVEVGAHLSSSFCSLPLARMTAPSRGESAAHVCRALSHAFLQFGPTQDCLQSVGALQRRLRAQTAFPRMLLCVRGCSPSLAALLTSKYGSLMGFWRALRRHGREACDADRDIRRLSTAQKKVFILLTEFLLAKDYY
ncbi:hypothetical protein ABB37_05712 [Leptomonas pyrrhocoris]|uniref:Crossover junction endonuclease MUS81 n=1 Tax=Leptomonas pyrrhocoris TaxID=157538 RepID=A0A0M9FZB8_LEPPY|nr:hypothetical protein ABB37_05712 [Leptomonas pyrrhocoris]KPA79230.1 hypothetical protein ABB37_05712 [Leptomonas pyrrhocoris]|eukprot:XP_015657669.1 hypothetical protein ABB37_05712 [Leptomonas pyrrhocoris]